MGVRDAVDLGRILAAIGLIFAALMGGPAWLIISLAGIVVVGLMWSAFQYSDSQGY